MVDGTAEQLSVTRFVDAPPAAVFDVLAHPTRHQETDPAPWRWVREPEQTDPITHAGQVFTMNMYLERVGGDYRIDNMVTAFEPPRLIAWRPGSVRDGELHLGGWEWRYDLVPEGEGTRVTLTYDWGDTSAQTRKDFGRMPPWPPEYLQESIDQLATTCESARTGR
ncbi:SRPBCC family protein [Allobranchiibius sp. GilTou38]|uniref:SRPBCC family protein n=1 Tax=Allobranchiibius sp. GilTou38 TaxID=2815210 RepID=UPI001AA130D8|nr:SRPBCC family protein [Allobranchiibius sp. GilTou38]MBO1767582.1 SRPBCC family protein [Allobranchiibius sp. GilTou38]